MTPSLALVLTLLGPASAEVEAGRADDLYARRNYAEASASYASAYEADPNPDYLWGWAQSERLAGNCGRAVELYSEYAALPVSQAAQDAAAKNARRCGEALADTEQLPPPPVVATPVPAPAPQPASKPADRWRSDILGLTLITAGGAVGVATLVLAADSAQQRRLAEDADIEAQYARKNDRAKKTGTAAVVCGVIATAAVTAGIVRLVLINREQPTRNAAAWAPGRGISF